MSQSKHQENFLTDSNTGSAGQCVICLDDSAAAGILLKLDCTHFFHKQCIEDWLNSRVQAKENPNCPNCRADLGYLLRIFEAATDKLRMEVVKYLFKKQYWEERGNLAGGQKSQKEQKHEALLKTIAYIYEWYNQSAYLEKIVTRGREEFLFPRGFTWERPTTKDHIYAFVRIVFAARKAGFWSQSVQRRDQFLLEQYKEKLYKRMYWKNRIKLLLFLVFFLIKFSGFSGGMMILIQIGAPNVVLIFFFTNRLFALVGILGGILKYCETCSFGWGDQSKDREYGPRNCRMVNFFKYVYKAAEESESEYENAINGDQALINYDTESVHGI